MLQVTAVPCRRKAYSRPCGQRGTTSPTFSIAVEFTRFPSHNCEKIKWQLTLFRDARTNGPGAFLYEGTRTTRRGVWTIQRGTPSNPNAQVYRLTPTPTGKVLSLLSVDDKVLLLLDAELRVLVGDASRSADPARGERTLYPSLVFVSPSRTPQYLLCPRSREAKLPHGIGTRCLVPGRHVSDKVPVTQCHRDSIRHLHPLSYCACERPGLIGDAIA